MRTTEVDELTLIDSSQVFFDESYSDPEWWDRVWEAFDNDTCSPPGSLEIDEVVSGWDCARGAAGLVHRLEAQVLTGRGAVTAYQLVDAVRAWQRVIDHAAVRQALVVQAWWERTRGEDPDGFHLTQELRAAMAWTAKRAHVLTETAVMFEQFPALAAACDAGDLEVARARILYDGTVVLGPTDRTQLIGRLVPIAQAKSYSQLWSLVAREVARLDPRAAEARRKRAVRAREFELRPDRVHSVADLIASGIPADEAVAVWNRINAIATAYKDHGDSRTLAQLRADITVALLLGRDGLPEAGQPHDTESRDQGEAADSETPGGLQGMRPPVKARIQLVVNLIDLLGLTQLLHQQAGVEATAHPPELAGFGPLTLALAKRVIATHLNNLGTEYDLIVTDKQGRPAQLHRMNNRFATGLLRHAVQTIWTTCPFPTCTRPSVTGEVDHAHDHAEGGATRLGNLHPPCKVHHSVKTNAGWKVTLTDNGHATWTAPSGHTHQSRAPEYTQPLDRAQRAQVDQMLRRTQEFFDRE